jgi:hypothetical protein
MLTEELYTVREASELPWLRLKYWTIWDHLKTGRLMKTKVGGKTFIRRGELEKLIVDVQKPRTNRRKRDVADGRVIDAT